MNIVYIMHWLTILGSFVTALVLEIAPWATAFQAFKPAWLVLVLFYWALMLPNKISIGWAFLFGLIWDLVLGSILGIHSLVLSVFCYFVSVNYQILRNSSLWMQALMMVLFVWLIRGGVFVIEALLNNVSFNWQELIGALISGILWPWIFLLLRFIHTKLGIK